MGKIIAICGKICCGKSYYANKLKEKENAVILSCDQLTSVLFDNNLGDKHEEMTKRIRKYLLVKAIDIVSAGTSVILDWGFWSKENRRFIKEYFIARNIDCQWHYIEIDDKSWKMNIAERNQRVLSGKGGSDYFFDDGLMKKLLSKWEEPTHDEIDVWYRLER